MAADLKVRIVGKDDTKKAFNSAKKGMTGLQKSALSLKSGIAALGVTLSVGLVIGGINKAIKSASDMREEMQKFGQVFGAVGEEAIQMRDKLKDSFNLGTQEATKLLAATGDLLTGFGFTDKAALDLSVRVQEAAADLASFGNIEGGVERASQSLTRALLGERESLKSLGISILEQDVKQEGLARGMEVVNGKLSKQNQAMVTLDLIMVQAAKSIGDVARSEGTFVQATKDADNATEDFATTMGELFLPASIKFKIGLAGMLKGITKYFDSVNVNKKSNEELERSIITLTASIDPNVAAWKRLEGRSKKQVQIRIMQIRKILDTRSQLKAEADELKAKADAQKIIDDEEEAREERKTKRKLAGIALTEKEIIINEELQTAKQREIETVEKKLELNATLQRGQLLLLENQKKDFLGTKAQIKLDEQQFRTRIQGNLQVASIALQAGAVIARIGKKNAILSKAIALGSATVHGFRAVTEALPNVPLAFAVGALAAANVAAILSTPAFQTPQGGVRTVPGPSTEAVPIIAHGGEDVGRGMGSGLTIVIEGNVFNSEETLDAISTGMLDFQNRTGFSFAS